MVACDGCDEGSMKIANTGPFGIGKEPQTGWTCDSCINKHYSH